MCLLLWYSRWWIFCLVLESVAYCCSCRVLIGMIVIEEMHQMVLLLLGCWSRSSWPMILILPKILLKLRQSFSIPVQFDLDLGPKRSSLLLFCENWHFSPETFWWKNCENSQRFSSTKFAIFRSLDSRKLLLWGAWLSYSDTLSFPFITTLNF